MLWWRSNLLATFTGVARVTVTTVVGQVTFLYVSNFLAGTEIWEVCKEFRTLYLVLRGRIGRCYLMSVKWSRHAVIASRISKATNGSFPLWSRCEFMPRLMARCFGGNCSTHKTLWGRNGKTWKVSSFGRGRDSIEPTRSAVIDSIKSQLYYIFLFMRHSWRIFCS